MLHVQLKEIQWLPVLETLANRATRVVAVGFTTGIWYLWQSLTYHEIDQIKNREEQLFYI